MAEEDVELAPSDDVIPLAHYIDNLQSTPRDTYDTNDRANSKQHMTRQQKPPLSYIDTHAHAMLVDACFIFFPGHL